MQADQEQRRESDQDGERDVNPVIARHLLLLTGVTAARFAPSFCPRLANTVDAKTVDRACVGQ
jgi:hypothetical protein